MKRLNAALFRPCLLEPRASRSPSVRNLLQPVVRTFLEILADQIVSCIRAYSQGLCELSSTGSPGIPESRAFGGSGQVHGRSALGQALNAKPTHPWTESKIAQHDRPLRPNSAHNSWRIAQTYRPATSAQGPPRGVAGTVGSTHGPT